MNIKDGSIQLPSSPTPRQVLSKEMVRRRGLCLMETPHRFSIGEPIHAKRRQDMPAMNSSKNGTSLICLNSEKILQNFRQATSATETKILLLSYLQSRNIPANLVLSSLLYRTQFGIIFKKSHTSDCFSLKKNEECVLVPKIHSLME